MVALLFLLACGSSPSSTPTAPPAPAVPAAPAEPAPGAMPAQAPATPRAMADSAFNEAMMAFENGDAQAPQAVARALAAYKALQGLDTDGQFHMALLQLAASDPAAARTTCDDILRAHPGHILALGTAGRAATKQGDAKATRDYYQRLVAAWDQPREPLAEFYDHDRMLPVYQKEALTWLATGAAP